MFRFVFCIVIWVFIVLGLNIFLFVKKNNNIFFIDCFKKIIMFSFFFNNVVFIVWLGFYEVLNFFCKILKLFFDFFSIIMLKEFDCGCYFKILLILFRRRLMYENIGKFNN